MESPNENHEVVRCAYCGKEFLRRVGTSTKKLGPGIRSRLSKNCSKPCAKIWRRSPMARKRKR